MTFNSHPNILLVMADQLTPFLLGAYGHRVVKTPHIDKLASEGVCFDAAYTPCPICAPARAALVTGKYCSNIHVYDNASPFSCDEVTLGHYLSNANFETVLDGKIHFVGPDQLHGFRRRLTTDIFPSDFSMLMTDRRKPLTSNHANAYITAGVKPWNQNFEFDEETHFRALQYLYSKNKAGNPFFLCVSYQHPHQPFFVTKEMWDLYQDLEIDLPCVSSNDVDNHFIMDEWINRLHGVEKVEEQLCDCTVLYNLRRAYYGMISYIDRKVGELISALEYQGLLQNTLVIFTSDHGDMVGERGMVQKRSFYEWSSRIPLIVRYPDGWKKAERCSQPVSLLDIVPTILDFAGIDHLLPLDGVSLTDVVNKGIPQNRAIFSEQHVEGVEATCFMMRKENYKFVHVFQHGSQLFNLSLDPQEKLNLSGNPEYQKIEEDLSIELFRNFQPMQIEKDILSSLRKRHIIQKSLVKNDTNWDYDPDFNPSEQYSRRRRKTIQPALEV